MKNKKTKNKKNKTLIGIIKMTSRGFAFVEVEDRPKDIYIHRNNINGAMHDDQVRVRLSTEFSHKNGSREEGIVVEVLKRETEEVIGVFEKNKGFAFVVPKNEKKSDVFISRTNTSGAKTGDLVVAKITKYPDGKNKAEGRVSEIIAKNDQADSDIKFLIREKGLMETFPSSVLAEANFVSKEKILPKKRVDLREKLLFTIDGDDSKDFDDAVSLEKKENGNLILGVHIADVAHYVKEGSALDREALKRGNSVYLLDRVLPMLPQNLSNGICSLNPNEDRLTLSIDMEIDKDLKVVNHRIYEGIINSKFRLTYDKVSDLIEKEISQAEWPKELEENLIEMNKLALALAAERKKEGGIDFDLDEAHITLNDEGVPVEVSVADRRSANKLIEQFMLLANRVVAEHFFHLQIPFVYRSHPKPDSDKMKELKLFLKGLDLSLSGSPDNIHPKMICKILDDVAGTNYEHIVSTVVLRSMQKAVYDTVGEGHFGLAYRYYCHFTSPIRRYPDLMIHRIIKAHLKGKDTSEFARKADVAAKKASQTERLAIELEREVEKLKKAEYMSYRIGKKYDGIISGITSFGIYVELENTIEGLVRESFIGEDYYQYEEEQKAMVGINTGETFTLGDKVRVLVDHVDVEKGQIDFMMLTKGKHINN